MKFFNSPIFRLKKSAATEETQKRKTMRGSTELDITRVGPKAFSVLMGSPSKHWKNHKDELIDKMKDTENIEPDNMQGCASPKPLNVSRKLSFTSGQNSSSFSNFSSRRQSQSLASMADPTMMLTTNLKKQQSLRRKSVRKSRKSVRVDLSAIQESFEPCSFSSSSVFTSHSAPSSHSSFFLPAQLRDCLQDTCGRWWFKQYCVQERSAENINFWEEVTLRYKTLSYSHQIEAARKIYYKYIEPDSACALNINLELITEVKEDIFGVMSRPSPSVFDNILDSVEKSMLLDTFSRFIHTEMYKLYRLEERSSPFM